MWWLGEAGERGKIVGECAVWCWVLSGEREVSSGWEVMRRRCWRPER
jgi:hypothetical protein